MSDKKINWKNVLKDKTAYPDDFVVALPDGSSAPLSEIRSQNDESEGSLVKEIQARQQDLDRQTKELEAAQANTAALYAKAQEALAQAQASGRPISPGTAVSQAADTLGLDESDPIYAPVAKAMKQLLNQNMALAQQQNFLKGALGATLQTLVNDHYERTFESVMSKLPEETQKTLNLQKVIEYANQNKLMDNSGRFDVRKAVKDMTAESDLQARIEAARKDEREKVAQENKLASMPRPGSRGPSQKPLLNKEGKVPTLDEAFEAASEDASIWLGETVQ